MEGEEGRALEGEQPGKQVSENLSWGAVGVGVMLSSIVPVVFTYKPNSKTKLFSYKTANTEH